MLPTAVRLGGITAATSVVDVLDHHCAIGCSIALPQFVSVSSVVGSEIDGVANNCEGLGITAATSVVDVLDHHCARGCSIALPQFASVGSVVGSRNRGWCQRLSLMDRSNRSRSMPSAVPDVDVLDHHRTRGCSVTLPQFKSVSPIIGSHKESVANSDQ